MQLKLILTQFTEISQQAFFFKVNLRKPEFYEKSVQG